MLKFKSRKEFTKKLQELDNAKAAYTVDMIAMTIWDIVYITDEDIEEVK